MSTILELYDLAHTQAADYLRQFTYPWEALGGIKTLIVSLGQALGGEYNQIAPEVWAHQTAEIAPSASITGPCIIGPKSQVRHCAFIRGSALIGENCVVGNSTELKNVILFDGVQVPHFNYVGDSILGYKAHMGAGSITSNVRGDRQLVTVHTDPPIPTGIKKVGAMLGDYAEIGCNSVLNPGTVIGRCTQVYPVTCVRGVVPANCIYKNDGTIKEKCHG
jgi:NDP-sugar pyrophosphorylase family protein